MSGASEDNPSFENNGNEEPNKTNGSQPESKEEIEEPATTSPPGIASSYG